MLKGINIRKEYGAREILNIDKMEIRENDRIGLIGKNGTGKSTLLAMLSGRAKGEGVITRNCEIAEILQDGKVDGIAGGEYVSRMRIRGSALKSGGEKTRLAIATAFSKHAPLIFADEPTTNLDRKGIQILERMLIGHKGAVVLISHDRELLDKACNWIWELENGKLRVFRGNYSEWCEQKNKERKFQEFEYQQYRKEKKRLENTIASVKNESKKMGKPPKRMGSSEWMLYKDIASVQQGHVQKKAAALGSRLNQLEKKERPVEVPEVTMKLEVNHKIKAKNAAKISGFSIKMGESYLYDVNMACETGKKTFLLGENGTGKTTLLKALIARDEGMFITSDAHVGYFSQDQDNLNTEKTVLQNVLYDSILPEHVCRAVLANLCMGKDDMDKKTGVLSGGERVKTAIAKILVSGCNFMILDEPTNHMDVYTMEGLERLLSDYDGTLLIVSHDRRLVQNLADAVYEIKDGTICKII